MDTKVSKALLVFCEGAHDAAFVKLIFKNFFDAKTEPDGIKIGDYPYPFDSLYQARIKDRSVGDVTLDFSRHLFLPEKTLTKDDWIILLFKTGGKENSLKAKEFLELFLNLMKQKTVFSRHSVSFINEAKYLFLQDSDYKKPGIVAQEIQHNFSEIAGTDWKWQDQNLAETERSSIQGDKGLYIWCDETGQKGTLEDILIPVYRRSNSELISKCAEFVDHSFEWPTKESEVEIIAQNVKKKKATLCIAGQGKSPGRPLSAILNDSILLKKDDLKDSGQVKEFVEFVKEFTGLISGD